MKLLLALLLSISFANAGETNLIEPLEPLRKMFGTWRGDLKGGATDVLQWERALNGQAIRILHSVNDGDYGGEVIVIWDSEKSAVTYHYFTTAGFRTVGTMKFEDGKVKTHETVTGAAGGITEVRSVGEVKADGAYHIKSEHLKNGAWEPGRDTTYKRDDSATVKFR
jgi:hypothetical protein